MGKMERTFSWKLKKNLGTAHKFSSKFGSYEEVATTTNVYENGLYKALTAQKYHKYWKSAFAHFICLFKGHTQTRASCSVLQTDGLD